MAVAIPVRFSGRLLSRGGHRRRVLHPATSRRAFTMVELVIVVLIVGILAAVAVPRFADSLIYYRAEAAAQRIKADLKLARQHAITSSSTQPVVFSTASSAYTLSGVPHLDHPSMDYEVRLSEPPYHASLVTVDFGGDALVEFDHFGTADTDGQVLVAAGAYQRVITLTAATGEIAVSE